MAMRGIQYGFLGPGGRIYDVIGQPLANTFLSSNREWTTVSASGRDGEVQFNDDGEFAGASNLTWDGVNLYINGVAVAVVSQIPVIPTITIPPPVESAGDEGQVQLTDGMGGFVASTNFTFDDFSGLQIEAEVYIHGLARFYSDVEITEPINGLIIKSPNGSRWRLAIGNDGAITSTAL